ncbi:MAG: ABC transporter substrate-binding protein, partial [Gammaproteobacteria bacterium]|nr:ABC transporter substrate-binding protein [Gammaproteobacteria bacterium]
KFQKELAKRSGTEETAMWPALTYTGMKFLEAAIHKAQSTDTDAVISALEGLTISTPVGPRTINAADHQADMGEFYGPMVMKDGKDYRVMDPVTYVPAKIGK